MSLALLLLFITNSLVSQEFAPIGATWNFPETFAFSPNQNVISFHSIGDTIIENKSYRIIEKDKWSCLLRFSGNQLIHQRNDSIFHLNKETDQLNLIIDFGSVPGESWFVNKYTDTDYSDGMQCYVDSIGTLTVNNQQFKLQYVTLKSIMNGEINEIDPYKTVIIEQIGFLEALFPVSFQGICDGNFEGKLRCYQDNNIGLINFSSEECLMTSIKEIHQNSPQVSIYPSPANYEFQVEIDEVERPKSIELFELSGKKVLEVFNTNNANVTSLENGLYLVKITLDNGSALRKIVIEK